MLYISEMIQWKYMVSNKFLKQPDPQGIQRGLKSF